MIFYKQMWSLQSCYSFKLLSQRFPFLKFCVFRIPVTPYDDQVIQVFTDYASSSGFQGSFFRVALCTDCFLQKMLNKS